MQSIPGLPPKPMTTLEPDREQSKDSRYRDSPRRTRPAFRRSISPPRASALRLGNHSISIEPISHSRRSAGPSSSVSTPTSANGSNILLAERISAQPVIASPQKSPDEDSGSGVQAANASPEGSENGQIVEENPPHISRAASRSTYPRRDSPVSVSGSRGRPPSSRGYSRPPSPRASSFRRARYGSPPPPRRYHDDRRRSPAPRRSSPRPMRRSPPPRFRRSRSRSRSLPRRRYSRSPPRRFPSPRRRYERDRSLSPPPRRSGYHARPRDRSFSPRRSPSRRRSWSRSPPLRRRSRSPKRSPSPHEKDPLPTLSAAAEIVQTESIETLEPPRNTELPPPPTPSGPASAVFSREPPRMPRAGIPTRDLPRPSVNTPAPPRGPRGTAYNTAIPLGPRSERIPKSTPTGPANSMPYQAPSQLPSPTPAATPQITHPTNVSRPTEAPEKTRHGPPLPSTPLFSYEASSKLAAIDADLEKFRSHRVGLLPEYYALCKGKRKVMHELYMATVELRTSESRRKTTADHLERAKLGELGIEFRTTEISAGDTMIVG